VNVPFQFQTGDDRAYSTSVRAVNRNQAEGTYTTTSYVSVATKDELRKALTAYPTTIKTKYLQLPSSIPSRVRDLAIQITQNKATAYDKAEAVETYLRNTYKYSTVVNRDTVQLVVSVAADGKTLSVYQSPAKRSIPLVPTGNDQFVGLEGGGVWTFDRDGEGSGPVKAIAQGVGPNRRVFARQ